MMMILFRTTFPKKAQRSFSFRLHDQFARFAEHLGNDVVSVNGAPRILDDSERPIFKIQNRRGGINVFQFRRILTKANSSDREHRLHFANQKSGEIELVDRLVQEKPSALCQVLFGRWIWIATDCPKLINATQQS